MPLSEVHPATRSKLELSQSKIPNFTPDLPSAMAEGDFMELLWENGQIVMQGQSSKPPKKPLSVFPSHSRIQEKVNNDYMAPRVARPAMIMDSPRGESIQSAIPGTITHNAQDDDMSPWFNSPFDDYYTEFLSELSGVNANSFPSHGSNLTLMDKGVAMATVGPSPVNRESEDAEPLVPKFPLATSVADIGRARAVNLHLQQWQNPMQNSKPGSVESSFVSEGNPCPKLQNNNDQRQDVSSSKFHVLPTQSTTTGVNNFSHFSRTASLFKANLHNGSRLRVTSNASSTILSNPLESIVISSPSGPKSNVQEHLGSTSYKAEQGSAAQTLLKFASNNSQSEAINRKDGVSDAAAVASVKVDNRTLSDLQVQKMGLEVMPMPPSIAKCDVERVLEPLMAPSSVCSGNGDAAESNKPIYRAKRKGSEEESGYHSEDIDDESMDTKKPSTSHFTTTKRSRAAEVHNLSERRRRDRINEKMRALQELIPNCNKADKASMLDEAIEYLKTLQLQVQIMSMSSGFCMPPMMFQPGMQHMRPPHMAHFPPMGVGLGMGIGVGCGMGMLDMNGNPLIPLQPIPNPRFPCSSLGSSGLHSIPPTTTTTHSMLGIPSQGVPLPMQCAPPFIPVKAHSAWPRLAPQVVGLVAEPFQAGVVDPPSSSDRHARNIGSEKNLQPKDLRVSQSSQTTKERVEDSSSAPTNDQVSNSEEAANSSIGIGNSSSGASYE